MLKSVKKFLTFPPCLRVVSTLTFPIEIRSLSYWYLFVSKTTPYSTLLPLYSPSPPPNLLAPTLFFKKLIQSFRRLRGALRKAADERFVSGVQFQVERGLHRRPLHQHCRSHDFLRPMRRQMPGQALHVFRPSARELPAQSLSLSAVRRVQRWERFGSYLALKCVPVNGSWFLTHLLIQISFPSVNLSPLPFFFSQR